MKPFDLDAALKGAPVITRSGRKATILGCWPQHLRNYPVIAVVVDGPDPALDTKVYRYTMQGQSSTEQGSRPDLFMVPVKVRRWLNVFDQSGTETADLFDSEAAALRQADELRMEGYDVYTAALSVEWEE